MAKKIAGLALLIAGITLIAASAGFFYYSFNNANNGPKRPALEANQIPGDKKIEQSVKNTGGYSVSNIFFQPQVTGTKIILAFSSGDAAPKRIPPYRIEEFPELGKTTVSFDNINSVDNDPNYEDIAQNTLIDSFDYRISGKTLVVELLRKGAYLPATVSEDGDSAVIFLASGNGDYPVILNQRPADNSAAFPAVRTISFQSQLQSPLKKAVVYYQNNIVEANATTTFPGTYLFEFSEIVEIDKEYEVKAVVTDEWDRTTVDTWTFRGEIPVQGILGRDRFKYLGWWGEINTNGISVRKRPDAASEKVGTLSSMNRVKIVKEVFGELIGENNLWYEIDGGKYPNSYVFSELVTPMVQPEPPAEFTIPETVKKGEKWIDVDLGKKILTLFDYDKPVFATYIAPGRAGNETEKGTFEIWYKLAKAEMSGGPPLHSYSYDLKNIPWVMYYNYDYAIHGTYWHDNFGTPQSAGCTNMTQGDAKYIFDNTLPAIPKGKIGGFSKDLGPGTVVHNH